MNEDYSKNYSEINYILNLLGNEYKSKIPKKLLLFFERNADKNYKPEITMEDFKNEKYLENTKIILAILNINYWASKADKEKYMEEIRKKDQEYLEKHKLVLHEIFPSKEEILNSVENSNNENQVPITKSKVSFFDKIKQLFKKK